MTLLSVVKDVCAVVGVLQPQSVFSNITGNRTMQEMLALANEMAQRIAYDTRDWTMLKQIATFPGDSVWVPPVLPPNPPVSGYFTGGTTAFALPANYKRMLLKSSVWRTSSVQQPMKFIPDTDQWMHRRARGEAGSAWGEWTIIGGQMHIQPVLRGPIYTPVPLPPFWKNSYDYTTADHATDPADSSTWSVAVAHTSPATGTFAEDRVADPTRWVVKSPVAPVLTTPPEEAYFTYIDKNCISLRSGGFGDVFTDDLDVFRLDERVLKLGMIWQWKAQKGSAYAEDLGTYGDALTNAMGHDSPAPIIVGDHRERSYARFHQ